jgi:hypothetical protein
MYSIKTLLSVIFTVALLPSIQGCMAIPGLAASLSPSSTSTPTYQVNADYDKVFTAVQSAMVDLSKVGISDRQTGMIQGQMGAAKTITVKIVRANPGVTFKVDVVNMAGIWGMLDPRNDGKTIADRVSSSLDLPVVPVALATPSK